MKLARSFNRSPRAPGWRALWLSSALLAAPVAAQLTSDQQAELVRQEATMQRLESGLRQMEEAQALGQCARFEGIDSSTFPHIDVLASQNPAFRDIRGRLLVLRAKGCTPADPPETVRPAAAAPNDRELAQRNWLEGSLQVAEAAQAQGACGPFGETQDSLRRRVTELFMRDLGLTVEPQARPQVDPAYLADFQRRLAAVLAEGCSPAPGSPWGPVAPIVPEELMQDSMLDEMQPSVSLLDRGEDPLLMEIREVFAASQRRCDDGSFEKVRAEYLSRLRSAVTRTEANAGLVDNPYRDALRAEEDAVLHLPAPDPCLPASPSPPNGSSLDWLIGVWRIPQGGAVGFRMEADGSASGYIAETTEPLAEAGYCVGQVFLRGCKDRTEENLAVWRYSANCAEGFRDTWQGAGIALIPVGETRLELPTYIGNPIAGYERLERITPLPESRPRCIGFVGKWKTASGEGWTPGELELAQDGDMLVGTYNGGPGRIRGRVSEGGYRFIGEMSSWIEPENWLDLRVDFRLSDDGKSFVGSSQNDSMATGWRGTCAL